MNETHEKLSANLQDLSILMEGIENGSITPKMHHFAQEIDNRALAPDLRQLLIFVRATPPTILELINAALPRILALVWSAPEKPSTTLVRMAALVEAVEKGLVTPERLEDARQIDGGLFDTPIIGLLGYISRTEPKILESRRGQFRTALAHAWVFTELLSSNLRSSADLIAAIENEAVTPELRWLAQEVDPRPLIPEIHTLISMVAGTLPSSLEYMNSEYRAELGHIWTAPEKLSANLRGLADLVEAIENEAITSKEQKLAQQIERRALVSNLRAVIRKVAGTSPSMLAFEQGDLRIELELALGSL